MTIGAAAFSAMGALTHALGDRCDWRIVALVRVCIMFLASASLATFARVPLVFLRPTTLWVRSLAGSFSLVCNFFAMTRLPVSNALVLAQTHPVWIVLLSPIVLRRAPTFMEMAGVACAMTGVVLIQPPEAGDRVATGVALASAVATSIAMLGLHRLRGVDSRAIVAHFAGVAIVVALVGLAIPPRPRNPGGADPMTWLMLIGVGITGTIGQVFLTKAYATGVPATVAVAGLTQVVFAFGFDAIIWGKRLTPMLALGFALVLAPSGISALSIGLRRSMRSMEPADPPLP
jgi:drug/metabolite transporter (DMT)-like permease